MEQFVSDFEPFVHFYQISLVWLSVMVHKQTAGHGDKITPKTISGFELNVSEVSV
jgi:hypothetical protein